MGLEAENKKTKNKVNKFTTTKIEQSFKLTTEHN